MTRFDTDTEVVALGDDRYAADVADGWDIRGIPNGGYVLAIAARALADAAHHSHVVSASVRFLRPATAGPCEIRTEPIRVGRRFSTVRASLDQDGERVLDVTGTVGELDGGTEVLFGTPPPDLGAPGDGFPTTVPLEGMTFEAPAIAERVEYRLHPESVGFSFGRPSGDGVVRAWMRFADGRYPDPLGLLLFADALPPAVFNTEVAPAWTPTVDLSVHCLRPPEPGWIAAETVVSTRVGEMIVEDGRYWDEAGHLVAVSRQLALAPRQ